MSVFEGGDPQEALRKVAESQREMVLRATSQNWYHWGLGGLAGALVAAQVAPLPFRMVLIGLSLCGVALLVQVYRRRTGVWVGGLRPGRTMTVAVVVGLVAAFGQVAAVWAGLRGETMIGLLAALAVFCAVTALGYAWDAAYRADMGVDGGKPVSAAPQFDAVIHPPNRLQICAMLAAVESAEFAVVRGGLGVSDSVLSKHVRQLEEVGYVKVEKATVASRVRTWLSLTAAGRRAFAAHLAALERLVAEAGAHAGR